MKSDLEVLKDLADELNVENVADVVLLNPKFKYWSGTGDPKGHHYGDGGLIKHTREVCELALINNQYFSKLGKESVKERWLFCACLFHDIGKVWDYERKVLDGHEKDIVSYSYGPHTKLIHHISRSGLIWMEAAKNWGVEQEAREEVYHAILAHHGRKEKGSPVEPKTKMAVLLHYADSLSARYDDVERKF